MLFKAHEEILALSWIAGKENEHLSFCPDPEEFSCLVGYLNFVHPYQITVLGNLEFTYLARLEINSYHDAIKRLFQNNPTMVIIAEGQQASVEMIMLAQQMRVPLVYANSPSRVVIDHLSHYLTNRLAPSVNVHGVFMEVFDVGVLLMGASGAGKSELALELINRNHRLIADDCPTFTRLTPDSLTGSCPELLQDFLEVRGIGILNIRAMFGNTAIKDRKQLHLIVQIVDMLQEKSLINLDRLSGIYNTREILGLSIPEVTLPAAPGRSLAILVEAAVRNQVLRSTGYDASALFHQRHKNVLEADALS
jgi:HPr kinase/phosphorylase